MSSIVLLALLVLSTPLAPDEFWDFSSYYFSSLAYWHSLNPYNYVEVNTIVAAEAPKLGPGIVYAYPLYSIYFFLLFTLAPWAEAKLLYLAINIVGGLLLIHIWIAFLKPRSFKDVAIFLICLIFAPGMPFIAIFSSGNTAIFEALLIWTGFMALLKSRFRPFLVSIGIAAYLKINAIAYLVFGLLRQFSRKNLVESAALILILNVIFLFPLVQNSDLFWSWATYLYKVANQPFQNHSSFFFIRSMAGLVGTPEVTSPIYGTWVFLCGIIFLSVVYKRLNQDITHSDIIFFLWTFAVMTPRVRPYSFVLLVPAVYFTAQGRTWLLATTLGASFILSASSNPLLSNHGLFLIILLNWLVTLRDHRSMILAGPLSLRQCRKWPPGREAP